MALASVATCGLRDAENAGPEKNGYSGTHVFSSSAITYRAGKYGKQKMTDCLKSVRTSGGLTSV